MVNGRVMNIHAHNNRCNNSRKELFGLYNRLDLRSYIIIPSKYKKGIVKIRVIYSDEVDGVEFVPYEYPSIKSLQMVSDNSIEYSHKYQERNSLNKLFLQKKYSDDIIIVRNKMLTDSYYGNIALLAKYKWYTPKTPLLKGVRRKQLLTQKKIIERDIRTSDIEKYTHICIFNAMIPFNKIVIPIKNIDW